MKWLIYGVTAWLVWMTKAREVKEIEKCDQEIQILENAEDDRRSTMLLNKSHLE